MSEVMVITGTRKGIGRYLVEYYLGRGFQVVGCSRQPVEDVLPGYHHYCLDVADEPAVQRMVFDVSKRFGKVDILINNAGIASMNHVLLTPLQTVSSVFATNVMGTFLFSREAAKVMMKRRYGRIVHFVTVATPLKLEGEAIYAASKAAVKSLTEIMAKEFAPVQYHGECRWSNPGGDGSHQECAQVQDRRADSGANDKTLGRIRRHFQRHRFLHPQGERLHHRPIALSRRDFLNGGRRAGKR